MDKRYALITGSTKGIGYQLALDLISEGVHVILNYAHSDEEAEEARKELSVIRGGEGFSIIKADLSNLISLDDFIDSVRKITQHLDYVILNAAITHKKPFGEISEDDWLRVFDANVNIPFFIVQKLSRLITNNVGRIIFMGAVMGMYPHAVSIPYGVSKSCLSMMAKYLVKEFADRRITVNVVAPGFVDTPWQTSKDPDHRKRIENKIALKRFADVSEVSQTCMHLIKNGYITGQTITVDGGYCYE